MNLRSNQIGDFILKSKVYEGLLLNCNNQFMRRFIFCLTFTIMDHLKHTNIVTISRFSEYSIPITDVSDKIIWKFSPYQNSFVKNCYVC